MLIGYVLEWKELCVGQGSTMYVWSHSHYCRCRCPLLVSIVGGVAAKLGEEEVAVFNTSYR